jgi:hypothetical protein
MRFQMTKRLTLFTVVLLVVVGCSQNQPQTDGGKKDGASTGDQAKLEALVLSAKPATPISVRDALTRKEGDKVVVTGRTPPEKVKPFNAAVAAVILLAPEDLDKDDIKDEFECDDAATCPSCKKILDQYAVRVELVDAAGAPIPASLEGFRGLKPGSTITVEGEVKRDGKDKKLVRIVATKFYPG